MKWIVWVVYALKVFWVDGVSGLRSFTAGWGMLRWIGLVCSLVLQ